MPLFKVILFSLCIILKLCLLFPFKLTADVFGVFSFFILDMYLIILKSRREILKHISSLDNSLKEREKSTKQLDVTRYEMLMRTLWFVQCK